MWLTGTRASRSNPTRRITVRIAAQTEGGETPVSFGPSRLFFDLATGPTAVVERSGNASFGSDCAPSVS
jgi:hypothetical protein